MTVTDSGTAVWADIDIDFRKDDDRFLYRKTGGEPEDGVRVTQDGTIAVTAKIPAGDSAQLRFGLSGSFGKDLEFAGIKLSGISEQDAEKQPPALDTNGDRYEDTPFVVASRSVDEHVRTLILTDLHDPDHYAGTWYYVLGVREPDGTVVWDDPKIYNKGEGG